MSLKCIRQKVLEYTKKLFFSPKLFKSLQFSKNDYAMAQLSIKGS